MTSLTVKDNLNQVITKCENACTLAGKKPDAVQLIVVSKNFSEDIIFPALEAGHKVFGENKVQEAKLKWPNLREQFDDVELHLIGPLQSNKTAEAVALFDVIHTVDREKIAKTLSKVMKNQNKFPDLLVQVNTGSESQKSGIEPDETVEFVKLCQEKYGLAIKGLMCIPPADENPGPHFALLKKLSKEIDLPILSMGMSSDYETAIEMGASHVRVGSAIFGARQKQSI